MRRTSTPSLGHDRPPHQGRRLRGLHRASCPAPGRREPRWWLPTLAALAILTQACGAPVGVTRVGIQAGQRLLTESAVSTAQPSEPSKRVLRRFGLLDRYDEDPAGTLARLHDDFVARGGEERLFALAELSFLHAERTKDRSYYLAAVVYAYALLFPGPGLEVGIDVSDRRFRLAHDLYNLGLAEAFRREDGDDDDMDVAVRKLPFGSLRVVVDRTGFNWLGYRLTRFVPAATLAPQGLRNRYWQPGIGAALVASLADQEARASVPGARRIGPRTKVPVTAFLRIEAPRTAIAKGDVQGRLDLYPADYASTVEVDGRARVLEVDYTAALGLWLSEFPIWTVELGGFIRPGSGMARAGLPNDRTQDGLFLAEPFRPDRIPVVLVHGTFSSPARWAELVNEMRGDRRIRDAYQIWIFQYDTGNPVAYSGGLLRRALEATIAELDPQGRAGALRRMVIVGHSQGGLLAKLTAVDSGTRFWDRISPKPVDALNVSDDVKDLLRRSLFFTPEPFVQELIYVATPHHGSYVAPRLARVAAWFITLPTRLAFGALEVLALGTEAQLARELGRIPTSVDNMSPRNPFIQTLASLDVAPWVHVHSIVAVDDDGPLETVGDGVVKYQSAHLEKADSELIVRSSHSVQDNPAAIEEIRRILLEHAGIH